MTLHYRWTREEIVEALQRDAERRGWPPSASDWQRAPKNNGRPCTQTVRTVFGSWQAALAAAKLSRPGNVRWPAVRIIQALQRDAARRGRPPTLGEWEKRGAGHPTGDTVQRVFGSWSRGLVAAGLKPQKRGGDRWDVCTRGHPLTGENLRIDPRGKRSCWTCRRDRDREWDRRRRRATARSSGGRRAAA